MKESYVQPVSDNAIIPQPKNQLLKPIPSLIWNTKVIDTYSSGSIRFTLFIVVKLQCNNNSLSTLTFIH